MYWEEYQPGVESAANWIYRCVIYSQLSWSTLGAQILQVHKFVPQTRSWRSIEHFNHWLCARKEKHDKSCNPNSFDDAQVIDLRRRNEDTESPTTRYALCSWAGGLFLKIIVMFTKGAKTKLSPHDQDWEYDRIRYNWVFSNSLVRLGRDILGEGDTSSW